MLISVSFFFAVLVLVRRCVQATLANAIHYPIASLTTAITFHQLFEGFSLGIRIAALPPAKPVGTQGGDDDDEEHEGCVLSDEEDEDEDVDEGEEETLIGANEAGNGGGYGSVSHKGVKSRSLTPNVAVRRRYRRGGRSVWKPWTWFRLSRRSRSNSTSRTNKNKNRAWLNPTLSILFAITTPVGMALGMLLWGLGSRGDSNPTGGTDKAQQHLISGLLSAISAGLLIYASTVEMIAGDFVFGDVDGGHGHGHGGGGDLEDHTGDEGEGEGEEGQSKVKIGKRALAVASLLAGSGMMVLVGLGE